MEARPAGVRTCLYDAAELNVVIENMALQAVALLAGKKRVVIIGILRRGAPLADMLQQKLRDQFGLVNIDRMNLQIKRYSDDLTLLHPETRLTEDPQHQSLDLRGTTVVVVDDVMYRGHSMLKAVSYLVGKQADEIRTLVLVDRMASKLPVRCDITGIKLEIAPCDIIECNVPPYENEFKIEVLQPHA